MRYLINGDRCPECGAEVLRHDIGRYDFCRGTCNILLNIPSYRDPDKKILTISCQVGGGKWQKITKAEFYSLSEIVEKFCRKHFVEMFPVVILH